MCGIAGIVLTRGASGRYVDNLLKMADAMHSRGPDDEGYLVAGHESVPVEIYGGPDTPVTDEVIDFYPDQQIGAAVDRTASVFLAHRRLSIIDLSAHGHQPMCTEERRYWVVFNGEIYNHKEVRSQLESEGVLFHGGSDTEVLLKAFRRWGADCVSRFNGMFAFVIWDDIEKKLYCFRDRIGIKPFYFTWVDQAFLFASDIATLIASGLYKPKEDIEGLYHALSFGVAPRPLTAFHGVYALEQGHWMVIDATGDVRKECYWKVPVGTQNPNMSEQEAIDLLDTELQRSIDLRLIADVDVGTFMSGGIDSTTIASLASMRHPGIKAFTLAFKSDANLDELAQAQEAAAKYGMDHIVKNIDDETVIDDLEEIVTCYEEPFYDISPNYIISKLVAENQQKVILTGLGGDELFGGYPYYKWEQRWRLLSKVRPLLAVASHFPVVGHLADRLYRIGKTKSGDDFATAVRSFVTDREKQKLFSSSEVKSFDTIDRVRELYVDDDVEFTSFMEAISYIDMVNYIGNHHVYRVDKFTMNFSIEGRIPFLDHELVEAAYRIPDKYKIADGQSKYVLRKVAQNYIPASCLEAKKKGFDLPTDRWLRGRLKSFTQEKLRALSERGVFSPKMIWKIYAEWKMRARSFRSVWELVSVEMWFEQFID